MTNTIGQTDRNRTHRFAPVLAIICVLLAVPTFVDAAPKADLYVAENGNDAWSGRLATPNAAKTVTVKSLAVWDIKSIG